MPYTVVQFTDHLTHGDTMHRLTWPMQALARLPEFHVIDVHYLSPYRYQLAFDADLLLLGVSFDAELVPVLRWRRARGKPMISEIHNHFFKMDPWNPRFEVSNNPAMQADCLQTMALVDAVQTSTPFLAEALKQHCSRTVVFSNQLNAVLERLPRKAKRPFVVGWGGSVSHIADMAYIAPALSQWITKRDEVVLSVMGEEAIGRLFTVPPEKKRSVPSGDMDAYDRFLKEVHVGLAPLCDTPFNRARSDVKWLEYAANGCVFVGQRLAPYVGSIEDGKTGFLFDDAAGLLRILDKLYGDRRLLASARRAAFGYVTKHRRYREHIAERAEFYQELLDREPPKGGDRWTLHEQVTFPQAKLPEPLPDYVPLTLEQDEERALAELHSVRTDVSEASIRLVEERYGDFHLTAYARGMSAFGRGDISGAEGHLRRSLSFYPVGVRSLALLGRVLVGMGRFGEGREVLSFATQWNRGYERVYHYLVAAMEQEKDWDAAVAATKEWERHCNQDPLARMMRGLLLIQAGQQKEGMRAMSEAMRRFRDRAAYWQIPFGADLIQMLRRAEPLTGNIPEWKNLIVEAAEMFPHDLWAASRAGAICFERGDYERGARILRGARERLLAWEWQSLERSGSPHEFRQLIEPLRRTCKDLTR